MYACTWEWRIFIGIHCVICLICTTSIQCALFYWKCIVFQIHFFFWSIFLLRNIPREKGAGNFFVKMRYATERFPNALPDCVFVSNYGVIFPEKTKVAFHFGYDYDMFFGSQKDHEIDFSGISGGICLDPMDSPCGGEDEAMGLWGRWTIMTGDARNILKDNGIDPDSAASGRSYIFEPDKTHVTTSV